MQMDLEDWLESKKIIRAQAPSQAIKHRAFVVDQLAPIMRELEMLGLCPSAVADALHHYAKKFRDKEQSRILNP